MAVLQETHSTSNVSEAIVAGAPLETPSAIDAVRSEIHSTSSASARMSTTVSSLD